MFISFNTYSVGSTGNQNKQGTNPSSGMNGSANGNQPNNNNGGTNGAQNSANNISPLLSSGNNQNISSSGVNATSNNTKGMNAVEREEAELETAPKGLILVVKSAGQSNLKVGQEVDGNLNPLKQSNSLLGNGNASPMNSTNSIPSILSANNNQANTNIQNSANNTTNNNDSLATNVGANTGNNNLQSPNAKNNNLQNTPSSGAQVGQQNTGSADGSKSLNNQASNSLPVQNSNNKNNNNNQPTGAGNQNQINKGNLGEPMTEANPGNNNQGPSVMVNSVPQAQQVQEEPSQVAQEPQVLPLMQQSNDQRPGQVDEVPQNPNELLESMEPQAL